jgi:hypothetical protein
MPSRRINSVAMKNPDFTVLKRSAIFLTALFLCKKEKMFNMKAELCIQ